MKRCCRAVLYTIGVLVLAFGLTLNTKTGLGTSPIISVSYGVAEIWSLNFGVVNFLWYALFVATEMLVRQKILMSDILQLPFSFVFSWLLNGFSTLITYDSAAYGLGMNLILLLAATVLTGIGITMTVNMRLVPNPGDGIVQAFAQRFGREQGFVKNIFDLSCVLIACILGLCFAGRMIGIGLGTVAVALGTGRAVTLINHFFKKKMCQAAGVT